MNVATLLTSEFVPSTLPTQVPPLTNEGTEEFSFTLHVAED